VNQHADARRLLCADPANLGEYGCVCGQDTLDGSEPTEQSIRQRRTDTFG
jgi:hypothetical protein